MVPFDVMTGRNCMVCNSRGVANLYKSFEMLGLPVMHSSFCFADVDVLPMQNRPFYSCLLSDLAYEWLRGCR